MLLDEAARIAERQLAGIQVIAKPGQKVSVLGEADQTLLQDLRKAAEQAYDDHLAMSRRDYGIPDQVLQTERVNTGSLITRLQAALTRHLPRVDEPQVLETLGKSGANPGVLRDGYTVKSIGHPTPGVQVKLTTSPDGDTLATFHTVPNQVAVAGMEGRLLREIHPPEFVPLEKATHVRSSSSHLDGDEDISFRRVTPGEKVDPYHTIDFSDGLDRHHPFQDPHVIHIPIN